MSKQTELKVMNCEEFLAIQTPELVKDLGDGLITIRPNANIKFTDEMRTYYIKKREIKTQADVLNWLYHMNEKLWFTQQHTIQFMKVCSELVGTGNPYIW